MLHIIYGILYTVIWDRIHNVIVQILNFKIRVHFLLKIKGLIKANLVVKQTSMSCIFILVEIVSEMNFNKSISLKF